MSYLQLTVRQRGVVFHQWDVTHANLGLCALRQSTWCVECPGGSGRPWPRPVGPAHYSDLTYGCPQHCHALCPPSDSEPGKPPSERSKLVLGWTLTGCSAHTCDTAGMLGPAVRLRRSGCRPRAHGSEMVGWCPECQRDCKGRSQTLMGG